MTQEIVRALVNGVWVTEVSNQGGGGGGSQPVFQAFGPFEVTAADIAALFTLASLTTDLGVENADLVFTAAAAYIGTPGNDFTISYVDPMDVDQNLVVTRLGSAITVTLATGPGGAITSTAGDVLAAVNAGQSSRLTVTLAPGSSGAGIVTAMSTEPLAGGIGWGEGTDTVEVELWTPNEGDLILGNPDLTVSGELETFAGTIAVIASGGSFTFAPDWDPSNADVDTDGYSYGTASDGASALAVLVHVGASPSPLSARIFTSDNTAPPPDSGAFAVTFVVGRIG